MYIRICSTPSCRTQHSGNQRNPECLSSKEGHSGIELKNRISISKLGEQLHLQPTARQMALVFWAAITYAFRTTNLTLDLVIILKCK